MPRRTMVTIFQMPTACGRARIKAAGTAQSGRL
jgi:hypothetical protein